MTTAARHSGARLEVRSASQIQSRLFRAGNTTNESLRCFVGGTVVSSVQRLVRSGRYKASPARPILPEVLLLGAQDYCPARPAGSKARFHSQA